MKINNAEILITGGAGFIGSNLAIELVNRGASVTLLDAMISPYGGNMFNIKSIKNQVKFIKGDVRNIKTTMKAVEGKDFVFHLAGQTGRNISMSNPILDTQINVLGTLNVIESIKNQIKRPKFIFAGSRGVCGMPLYLPVDEKHPDNPRDIYGINKLSAEKAVLLLGKENGFKSVSLRLNNVYGPKCQIKSNHYGTINLFISYALRGKVMPIYGDGLQTRDYIYVSDVVDAFIRAMQPKANNKYYYVGTNVPTSLLSVVELIQKKIPNAKYKKVPFPDDLKSVDFPDFYSSSSLIGEELGWKAKVSIEEGIEKTIEFYKENLEHYL